MKNIIIIFITIVSVKFSFGQRSNVLTTYVLPKLTARQIAPLDCSNTIAFNNCNIIQNGTFIPNDPNFAAEPFNENKVPFWESSHGSTMIYYSNVNIPGLPFPAPPNGVPGFSMSYSGYIFESINPPPTIRTQFSEGVAQKITPLIVGNNYQLTFKELIRAYSAFTAITNVKIVLMHCSDFNVLQTPLYYLPSIPLPPITQTIYCELGVQVLSNWEKRAITFTANSNYDAIMIYPEPPTNINYSTECFYSSTDFQLTQQNSLSIIASQNPCNSPCVKTLSPSCILNDITYTWNGPNGQTITGNSIDVNTSLISNQGTWTVSSSSTSPVISSNNTCSTNGYVPMLASYTIYNCSQIPCINLPLIQ